MSLGMPLQERGRRGGGRRRKLLFIASAVSEEEGKVEGGGSQPLRGLRGWARPEKGRTGDTCEAYMKAYIQGVHIRHTYKTPM